MKAHELKATQQGETDGVASVRLSGGLKKQAKLDDFDNLFDLSGITVSGGGNGGGGAAGGSPAGSSTKSRPVGVGNGGFNKGPLGHCVKALSSKGGKGGKGATAIAFSEKLALEGAQLLRSLQEGFQEGVAATAASYKALKVTQHKLKCRLKPELIALYCDGYDPSSPVELHGMKVPSQPAWDLLPPPWGPALLPRGPPPPDDP